MKQSSNDMIKTNIFDYLNKNSNPIQESKIDPYMICIGKLFGEGVIGEIEYKFMKDYKGSIAKSSIYLGILAKIEDGCALQICKNKFNNFHMLRDVNDCCIDFKFTDDQQTAINKILNLLMNKVNVLGLYGSAGTGKTTIVTKFMYHLLANDNIQSIVFTAPTNKALNVLRSKFREDLGKLVKVKLGEIDENCHFNEMLFKLEKCKIVIHFMTIHKLLKYKSDVNDKGEKIFVKDNGSLIDKYELVIVDEVSMVQGNLITDMFNDVFSGKEGKKMLFLGDEAQLPPVDEQNSMIFDPKIPYVANMETIALTTIMRSNGNVTNICNEQRKKVLDLKYVPQFFKYNGGNVKLYKYDGKGKTNTTWFKNHIDSTRKGYDSLILAWTNRQTDEYNYVTRKLLFGDNLKTFEIGDVLTFNGFCNMKWIEKEGEGKHYSSELMKVVNVHGVVKSVGEFAEHLSLTQKISGMVDIVDKYVKIMKTINKSTTRNYNSWKLKVCKLDSNGYDANFAYVLNEDSADLLENDRAFAHSKITELVNYYRMAHKEHFATLEKHVVLPLWRIYNSKFIDTFVKADASHALTVHKSQGSTFYNVFVDAIDILKNQNKNDAARCLYTAMTRVSNELHLLHP